MIRIITAATLLVSALTAADLTGHWEGTATRDNRTTPVLLDVEGTNATLGLPGLEVLGIPVELDDADASVQFAFTLGGADHAFALNPVGERLAGKWQVDDPATELDLNLSRVPDTRPYTEEEIAFHSDVKLAGTLFVPKSPGPHAGIALIHGSGDNVRWTREYYADFFARQGLAVVFFDKRGNGDSGGDWREVGFEPLARDGIAALDFLAARPDIRKDALGLWGISQAGWIMTLAATLSDRVDFLIVTSGATVNVEEEGYYDYLVQLEDAGYGDDVQRKMLEILTLDNEVTRTGEGYEELRALVEPVRREMWMRQSGYIATPPDFAGRDFMRRIIDFDPRPYLEQLDIPVLWLYGEADKSVEAERSIGILNEIMRQGEYDFTIRSFAGADHGIRVAQAPDAIVQKRLAAPGYWATIADWLDEHGLAGTASE